MRKLYSLLITFLLFFSAAKTQGIYQLWGMSPMGGDDQSGNIFNTDFAGNNYQLRHHFSNNNAGREPAYEQPIEYNGKFYGMARLGGILNPEKRNAIIFEWDPASNIYTKKYTLSGINGTYSSGSLTLNGGKFYGMTGSGGLNGYGIIFEWDPTTNIFIKKFDFNGIDGGTPFGSLTLRDQKLYGMTEQGGSNNSGVIFEWDPMISIYTKRLDFIGSNGSYPKGSLTYSGTKFYGMTYAGGDNDAGVIFEWDPGSNVYTKKIDLNTATGRGPYNSLTEKDGKFYGMTNMGGIDDEGVIFEWDPVTNIYTKKVDLNSTIGSRPHGNLTLNNGLMYGITTKGGSGPVAGGIGGGVVFKWDPLTNIYTIKYNLNDTDGNTPLGSLTLFGGKFYGLTNIGGIGYSGVMFEWDPVTNIYLKRMDFSKPDNGDHPNQSLSLFNKKYYGTATGGGTNSSGGIFEFDPETNTYVRKIDLNGTNGSRPSSNLMLYEEKFYGMTNKGGSNDMGVIFEWDPTTNIYTKKIDFNTTGGSLPKGSLTKLGNKFYGMTSTGGNNDVGVIFEWDPMTNIYTKKIDLNSAEGSNPNGALTYNGSKFYGMTSQGGVNDRGVIFEWDPFTNIYAKMIDFIGSNGRLPNGSLTFNGSTFYGMTQLGGSEGGGVIFEWDPLTNGFLIKFNFPEGYNNGHPNGSLTQSGGKYYGMTIGNGLENSRGGFFEWDPVTNIQTIKQFTGGRWPNADVVTMPAPVAKGLLNNCMNVATVTIDNSNNNIWVPIIDEKGDAVAEIKANGNNLGAVTTSLYINDGTVREDEAKNLYLDRNITISPSFQPTSAVDVRLYLRNSEYFALKNATNSAGQHSNVNSISDVGIRKNADSCSAVVVRNTVPVSSTSLSWEANYVLSTTVNSFSSFYFYSLTQGGPLPVSHLEFNGRLLNNNAELNWKTTDEYNIHSFDLERSTDGMVYTKISNVPAVNQLGIHHYNYSDKNISLIAGTPVIYYRLKQKDLDGRFAYSRIIPLSKKERLVQLFPNPVNDKATLAINIPVPGNVQVRLLDNIGRKIKEEQWILSAGRNSISFDVNGLPSGIYYLELNGGLINERKRFIKK